MTRLSRVSRDRFGPWTVLWNLNGPHGRVGPTRWASSPTLNPPTKISTVDRPPHSRVVSSGALGSGTAWNSGSHFERVGVSLVSGRARRSRGARTRAVRGSLQKHSPSFPKSERLETRESFAKKKKRDARIATCHRPRLSLARNTARLFAFAVQRFGERPRAARREDALRQSDRVEDSVQRQDAIKNSVGV